MLYIILIMVNLFGLFAVVAPPARAETAENDLIAAQSQLEAELKAIEEQIAAYEQELKTTQKEKQTLVNKIKQLTATQKYLRSRIKSTTIQINSLSERLTKTEKAIQSKQERVERLNDQLRLVIKTLARQDDQIFVSLASADGLDGAVTEMQNYAKLSIAIKRITDETRTTKKDLEHQATIYDEQKDDAEQLLNLQSIQQKELVNSLNEQAELLEETKGKENNYQALISDTKKRAAEIRNRIYELVGGVKQINFGEAVAIAEWISKNTGIRTAYVLAVLTQESNLGKNVGTCNRVGDPPEKSWRVVMKPERDHEPFLTITGELGMDPETTPVSCPMKDKKGNQFGWGGAMGPAQFIPSTWMGYRDKVTALTGKSTANPWDIRDAFAAAAIKLKRDGADGTTEGERKAALRYFSGSTNNKYRFYADNVLAIAERYEKDIVDLKK